MDPADRNALHDAWRRVLRDGARPLLLVRHGRTVWNAERRFLGSADVPLDAEGRRQAERLAEALRAVPLDAAVSSPLSRAADTARAVLARRADPPPLRLDPDLAEVAQGVLEGVPVGEAEDRFPEVIAAYRADPATARAPGGERLVDCRDRVLAALLRAARLPGEGPVLVVSHQMAIRSVLCTLLGIPLARHREVHQDNTAVNVLAWDGRSFRVRLVNHAAHLAPAG